MPVTFLERLNQAIDEANSLLCVGLDLDRTRMPKQFASFPDGFVDFARAIIEATSDCAAAYKPNLAFYECYGAEGWRVLERVRELIPANRLAIADAKRGDIGNTSRKYAEAIFDSLGFDAITLSPYMGQDSLEPFFEFADRGCFVLCATSNKGADDFQVPEELYLKVARRCIDWNTRGNVGLVVGATRCKCLAEARRQASQMPLLVPGVGARGCYIYIYIYMCVYIYIYRGTPFTSIDSHPTHMHFCA